MAPAVTKGWWERRFQIIRYKARVSCQNALHCPSISFDQEAAHAFHLYIDKTLAFTIKHSNFLYSRIVDDRAVAIDFIYEPPGRAP